MSDGDASSNVTTDTDTDTGCSNISTNSMDDNLNDIIYTINALYEEIGAIDTNLKTLTTPLTDMVAEQLSDVKFLENSPFRTSTFMLREGVPLGNMAVGKRYAFKDIVETLRVYLFDKKLVEPDGTIQVNETLRLLFEIQETETTFPTLLLHLRRILV
jgi:hypothetical protein